jgi:hypothetical protein
MGHLAMNRAGRPPLELSDISNESEIPETDWTVRGSTGDVPRNTATRSPKRLGSWKSMLRDLGMSDLLLGSLELDHREPFFHREMF